MINSANVILILLPAPRVPELTLSGCVNAVTDHQGDPKEGRPVLLCGEEVELLGQHLAVQAYNDTLKI